MSALIALDNTKGNPYQEVYLTCRRECARKELLVKVKLYQSIQ